MGNDSHGNANIELEKVPCNLCGGTDFRFLYKKPDTRYFVSDIEFNVVRCRNCGLAFVNPRPSMTSFESFYLPRFYEERGCDWRSVRYKKEARYLADLKPGRVLDIGCAGGVFLKLLQDQGWEVYGMDFSSSGGNVYNLDIRYGDISDIQYQSDFFDCVTAWAVFEHLYDPIKYFKEVFRILKPGGRFVFLVTNIRSLFSRYAYYEDIPRHLYFFSERTMKEYAKQCGLDVDKINFSNDIYSGKGAYALKVNVMRWLGISWKNIFNVPQQPPLVWSLDRGLTLLGRLLIWPRIEILLRCSGIMIVTMQKP